MSLPPHHEASDGGDEDGTANGPAMAITLPASLLELDLTTLQELLRRTGANMQSLRNVTGPMGSTVELLASSHPFDEDDDDEDEYRPPRSSRQRARRWDHSPETLRIERDLDLAADQQITAEHQLRAMPTNEHRRRQRARRMYISPDFIRRAREDLEDDKELMAALGKVADVHLSYEGMIHMAHGYFGAEEAVNERDVRYINGFGFSVAHPAGMGDGSSGSSELSSITSDSDESTGSTSKRRVASSAEIPGGRRKLSLQMISHERMDRDTDYENLVGRRYQM
ncbi:Hypothetical predicted protein [Lecanosticta acicola]|uniref:Uncharacterized protein n=1 Tax=Lecanosticta acicola TaxID=111012 RepID=A0AAI8W1V3_9PEZI|nr:Hypothetical predicted protein [Lecanosticta acicola]